MQRPTAEPSVGVNVRRGDDGVVSVAVGRAEFYRVHAGVHSLRRDTCLLLTGRPFAGNAIVAVSDNSAWICPSQLLPLFVNHTPPSVPAAMPIGWSMPVPV